MTFQIKDIFPDDKSFHCNETSDLIQSVLNFNVNLLHINNKNVETLSAQNISLPPFASDTWIDILGHTDL